MINVPAGATHTAEFYGSTHFWKRIEFEHLNQVSEEVQTLVRWEFWNGSRWVDSGPFIRTDRFIPLRVK